RGRVDKYHHRVLRVGARGRAALGHQIYSSLRHRAIKPAQSTPGKPYARSSHAHSPLPHPHLAGNPASPRNRPRVSLPLPHSLSLSLSLPLRPSGRSKSEQGRETDGRPASKPGFDLDSCFLQEPSGADGPPARPESVWISFRPAG
uniref:Uncharacterized protein n=1 Tax=Aegilops tauschii subsp. strangulata TaxID=200361 RepID=A0A453J305_AEGTS